MDTPKSQKPQAHGITHGEMKLLQEDQINEVEPNTIAGNVDSEYRVRVDEKHLIHAEIEVPEFSASTGTKISVPRIQKYTPKEFKDHESNNGFAGLKVTVLHNPAKKDEELTEAIKDEKKVKGGISKDGEAVVTGKNGEPSKALDKMSLPELRDRYNNLYAEKADESHTKKDLIALINEKLEFIKNEEEAVKEQEAAAKAEAESNKTGNEAGSESQKEDDSLV